MKKIEVLAWGMKHIAGNYQMEADTESYNEDGQMCIYVTDFEKGLTPAPINDVQMLCHDLGIPREFIETSEWGVDVYLDYAWLHTKEECEGYCDGEFRKLLADYEPTGFEMWKRSGAVIGN